MLSLTPLERLEVLQATLWSIRRLRGEAAIEIDVGQSVSEPMDLASYVRGPDGTIAVGCYVVTFWYKDRAADFMDAPGRLQMALVSKEMRICVTDGR